MKSLKKIAFGVVAWIGLMAINSYIPGDVCADDYTVLVSTIDLTSSAANFTAHGAPNISGGVFIDKLIISSSDTAAVSTLSVYDTATSSAAAVLVGKFHVIPSTQGYAGLEQVDFPSHNPWKLTDPAFVLTGTVNKMNVTVIYR